MTDASDLPAGEYAIVECMGHRTLVGRISEVERFGTKMMSMETIWNGELLDPIYLGGPSIYQLTPCSAEAALKNCAKHDWDLPASVRAVTPDALIEGPEPEFAPAFLAADDDDDGVPF